MSELVPIDQLEALRKRRERFADCLAAVSILPVEIINNVYYVNFEQPELPDEAA
jgi:hypothetical protein